MTVLKILSSQMDLAKSGLIRKVLIKGRGAEIFSKIPPSPIPSSCESLLKIPRDLVQLLNPYCQERTLLCLQPYLQYFIQLLAMVL